MLGTNGFQVTLADCPKYPRARPDFMVSGANVVIDTKIKFVEEEDEEGGSFGSSNDGGRSYAVYKSDKVLGKLYRAIDERVVFQQLQKQSSELAKDNLPNQSVMQRVWNYVQDATAVIQWKHHLDWARDIQEK